MPAENKMRHSINDFMQTISNVNNYYVTTPCKSQNIFYTIDINCMIKNKCISMTKPNKYYLGSYNFRQVANSLHYFLHIYLAMNLANQPTASFEQEKNMTSINLESVPSNLN